MRLRARPSVERRAVDRQARRSREQELDAADVVLVAVGGDAARRCASAFSRRYVKSGSTRSMPCMSAPGNISPQSMSRIWRSSPPPARSPCSCGRSPRARRGRRCGPARTLIGRDAAVSVLSVGNASRQRCRFASTSAASCVDEPGVGAHRQPGLADGDAEVAQHRLGRDRVGRLVAGLEREALEHAAVDEPGADGVALRPTGRTVSMVVGRSSASPRRRCRRADSPAAAASSRRRRCRPRSRRAPSDQRGRLARVAGGVLEADDVRHLAGQPAAASPSMILRPVRTGMS